MIYLVYTLIADKWTCVLRTESIAWAREGRRWQASRKRHTMLACSPVRRTRSTYARLGLELVP